MMTAPTHPSALDAHLGYWLRAASNAVSQAFADKLAEQGTTVAEWVLLRMVFDHEALAPSLLAENMGMTRGGISKLVDRLAARGLLVRRGGGEDRRYQAVVLTGEGRALVPDLAALADANDAEFFGDLDAGARETIETAMRVLLSRRDARTVPTT